MAKAKERENGPGPARTTGAVVGGTEDEKTVLGSVSKDSGRDPDERRRQIAEAAYYRALKRGFEPGREEADWIEAEKQIDGGS